MGEPEPEPESEPAHEPEFEPAHEPEPEPEPEVEPAPEGCMDSQLPARWSHDGIYNCGTYFNHGGVAYCAHEPIKENCCFCRKPSSMLDVSSTKPTSVSAEPFTTAHPATGKSFYENTRH